MTTKTCAAVVVLLSSARIAVAQPPRPADPTRTVTLAIGEYNRLLDLSRQPPQPPAVPPLAAVLSSADLTVRVDRDTARGVFNLAGNVLRDGVSRVPLLSGATVVDATAAGQPLPLVAEGGSHSALLPGPGPFSLTLEWGAPLVFTPGRASFTLPVPQSGTARATFDLPGEQADVRLSTGVVSRRLSSNGRTIIEAALEPGSASQVSWSMRDSAPVAAARDIRTLADVFTLVTLDDSDVRLVTLVDVTVVQGDPRTIAVRLPAGYEMTSVSGSTVESSELRDGRLVLTLSDPSARRHQILVSLERPHEGGSLTLDTGVPTLVDAGRERGEIAVEGVGTLELTAAEREGMHRIDVKELNSALQSLARLPILSAFRYQRASAVPGLAIEVKRFADAGVLAAVADRAYATTLITNEGRALTQIALTIQNRAQPFLKVMLPTGASIVSVDIHGQPAKPVLGADGTRVPLLRPGFRPNGPYTVSFVYLHAGTPFARKGSLQMTLPRMDVPVGLVQWEMFFPSNYSVRSEGGNVIDVKRLGSAAATIDQFAQSYPVGHVVPREAVGGAARIQLIEGAADLLRGRVVDHSGAVLPGVSISIVGQGFSRTTVTQADGTFSVVGVPPGAVTVTADLSGFRSVQLSFTAGSHAVQVTMEMLAGGLEETVMVSGQAPPTPGTYTFRNDDYQRPPREERSELVAPSQNVVSLQRRVEGVLPVPIDVPRAGTLQQFVRPLVVDQEATVTLRYRRRG